jgi:hypothetical protein
MMGRRTDSVLPPLLTHGSFRNISDRSGFLTFLGRLTIHGRQSKVLAAPFVRPCQTNRFQQIQQHQPDGAIRRQLETAKGVRVLTFSGPAPQSI